MCKKMPDPLFPDMTGSLFSVANSDLPVYNGYQADHIVLSVRLSPKIPMSYRSVLPVFILSHSVQYIPDKRR